MPGIVRSFDVHSLVFQLRANDPFSFPAFLTGNVLRGALGSFLQSANPNAYEILFGQRSTASQVPRPFVLRCRNLDGKDFAAGETFSFDINLFLTNLDLHHAITAAVVAMGEKGFGPNRSRASVSGPPEHVRHALPLDCPVNPTCALRIHFNTPTELKHGGEVIDPSQFAILLAQIHWRLNRLSTLYGEGALAVNGKLLRERAESVQIQAANLASVKVSRRGSRSGRIHPLGGVIGSAEYSGCLSPFVPLLKAAAFTGVGRHTVWGNGEISPEILA
ncbi:MAG: CRISPR system precrRNA processing endoribonuclease RAMP protein Cas6 [Bryobacteraceae bacterium]